MTQRESAPARDAHALCVKITQQLAKKSDFKIVTAQIADFADKKGNQRYPRLDSFWMRLCRAMKYRGENVSCAWEVLFAANR